LKLVVLLALLLSRFLTFPSPNGKPYFIPNVQSYPIIPILFLH
jgi:hypothetical protein